MHFALLPLAPAPSAAAVVVAALIAVDVGYWVPSRAITAKAVAAQTDDWPSMDCASNGG